MPQTSSETANLWKSTPLDAHGLALVMVVNDAFSSDMFVCQCDTVPCCCKLMPFTDRVALALLCLDDDSLLQCMTSLLRYSLSHGDINGVILSGLPAPWCVYRISTDTVLTALHNSLSKRLSDLGMSIIKSHAENCDDLINDVLLGTHLYSEHNARLHIGSVAALLGMAARQQPLHDPNWDINLVALARTTDNKVSHRMYSLCKVSRSKLDFTQLFSCMSLTPQYPYLLLLLGGLRALLNKNSQFQIRACLDVALQWYKWMDALALLEMQAADETVGSYVPNVDALMMLATIRDNSRAVRILCSHCQRVITPVRGCEGVSNQQHKLDSLSQLQTKALERIHANNVCECSRQFPTCAVCLHRLSYNELTKFDPNWGPIDSWFSWCNSCQHGGHYGHLAAWFKVHDNCPVPGCGCRCMRAV